MLREYCIDIDTSDDDDVVFVTSTILPFRPPSFSIGEIDSDIDHCANSKPLPDTLPHWNDPIVDRDEAIRYTCPYCKHTPFARLQGIYSHWQNEHHAAPTTARGDDDHHAVDNKLPLQPFRYGLDWAVLCHKCKCVRTLGTVRQHYREQHTDEIFAISEVHQTLTCAMCINPRGSPSFPHISDLFVHFMHRHEPSVKRPAAAIRIPDVRDWLSDRQLEALSSRPSPCPKAYTAVDECVPKMQYGCPLCERHSDDLEVVVLHLWRHHLPDGCEDALRLERYEKIQVLFANGLWLTADQLSNTMIDIAVHLRTIRNADEDVISEYIKPYMPSMVIEPQPDCENIEDTLTYAHMENIPVDEGIMAGNLEDALFPVDDDDDDDAEAIVEVPPIEAAAEAVIMAGNLEDSLFPVDDDDGAEAIVDVPPVEAAAEAEAIVSNHHIVDAPPQPEEPLEHKYVPLAPVVAQTTNGRRRRTARTAGARKRPKQSICHIDLSYSDESDDLEMLLGPQVPHIELSDYTSGDEDDNERIADIDDTLVDRKPDIRPTDVPIVTLATTVGDDDVVLHRHIRYQCLVCPQYFATMQDVYTHWRCEHFHRQSCKTFYFAVDIAVRCRRCGDEHLLRRLREHCRAVHGTADVADRQATSLTDPSQCGVCERPFDVHTDTDDCLRALCTREPRSVWLTDAMLDALLTMGFRGRVECLNCRGSYLDEPEFRRHHEMRHPFMMALCQQASGSAGRAWCPLCAFSDENVSVVLEHCAGKHLRRYGCLVCRVRVRDAMALRLHQERRHGLCGERGWRLATDWAGADGEAMRRLVVSLPNGLVVTRGEIAGGEARLGEVFEGWDELRVLGELRRLDEVRLRDVLQRRRIIPHKMKGTIRIRLRRDVWQTTVEKSSNAEEEEVSDADADSVDSRAIRQMLKCRWCGVRARATTRRKCKEMLRLHGALNHPEKLSGDGDVNELQSVGS